jgi:ABC-type glycerol-3-phosphate transport system substrate-binding protein
MSLKKNLMILSLAGLTLAGCVNSSSEKNNGPVTIEFWTGFGAAVNEVLNPLLEQFTKDTGIKVNYTAQGGYPNLQLQINLGISSKSFPHIANGYPDHFAGYMASGIILPLDSYIANDTADDVMEKLDIDSFYPDFMLENRSFGNDKNGNPLTMGIPFNKSTEVAVVNSTFFEWLNSEDETIVYPETWAQVDTIGTKIVNLLDSKGAWGKLIKKDGTVATTATPEERLLDLSDVAKSEFRVLSYDSQANYFITQIRQKGGVYTYKNGNKGYIGFDNPQTREAMNYQLQLFNKGLIGIPATWGEAQYCSNEFKVNKTLINIGSSAGVYNSLPASDAFKVSVAPVPYYTENSKFVISQGTNLALLNKGTKPEQDAAWKLLKYLTQHKAAEFAVGTGYFPASEKVASSKAYSDLMTAEDAGARVDLIRDTHILNTLIYNNPEFKWNKFVDPGFVGSTEVRNEAERVSNLLFYQDKTIDWIIDDLYRILRDYKEA